MLAGLSEDLNPRGAALDNHSMTRIWSALALMGLLAVGVGGGVAAYLEQQRLREEAAKSTTEVKPNPVSQHTSQPATGGEATDATKTEGAPGKGSVVGASGSKTSPP